MNTFQFAVASIVDANTGNGLVRHSGPRDYLALEQHGRKIRSKSIIALFTAIKVRLGATIDNYRIALKQRRDLQVLMHLSDHLLEDIGLTRGDLNSVQLGATSLEELNDGRRSAQQAELGTSSAIDRVDHGLEAINEQFYHQKKCA